MHTFVGNLVADVEVFEDRVSFRLAFSERYRDQSGVWQKKNPVFHSCVAWGKRAANIAALNPRKGMPVVVVGGFARSEWTDKETGMSRASQNVVVEHFGIDVCNQRAIEKEVSGANQQGSIGELPAQVPSASEQGTLDAFTGGSAVSQWEDE